MNIKIGVKDKKLLSSILENARKSYKQIAKEIGISKDAAEYRTKKLIENGIIKSFQARINLTNFVYGNYILLAQLSNLSLEKEKEIFENLKKIKYALWLGKVGGEFDLFISFSTKNLKQLGETINEIFAILGNIKKYSILTMTSELKDSFKSLFSDKKFEKLVTFDLALNEKLDSIDKKILYILNKNSKVSNREVSEKVKISEEAIRVRIKNLEKRKIIINYRTILDENNLGLSQYILLLNFSNFNLKVQKQIEEYALNNKDIVFASRIVGEYNLILSIYAENEQDFFEKLLELRNHFANSINFFTSLNVFSTKYHNQLPEGILD
ncbi:MAG: Lrp/AsnC family transcriptional regulator [Nanoarchaeota archaeon]